MGRPSSCVGSSVNATAAWILPLLHIPSTNVFGMNDDIRAGRTSELGPGIPSSALSAAGFAEPDDEHAGRDDVGQDGGVPHGGKGLVHAREVTDAGERGQGGVECGEGGEGGGSPAAGAGEELGRERGLLGTEGSGRRWHSGRERREEECERGRAPRGGSRAQPAAGKGGRGVGE